MLCAFSKFQPSAPPVLSGRFDFKICSSSTEVLWSLARSDANNPKRRCRIFHLRAVTCTSIIVSLGSWIGASPRRADPRGADAIAALTNLTCYIVYYMLVIHRILLSWWMMVGMITSCTSGAMRSRRRKGRVRSNILTLSPVICLPACLSTYMSIKWVA